MSRRCCYKKAVPKPVRYLRRSLILLALRAVAGAFNVKWHVLLGLALRLSFEYAQVESTAVGCGVTLRGDTVGPVWLQGLDIQV